MANDLQPNDLIIRRPRGAGAPWSIWKSLIDGPPSFVEEKKSRVEAEIRASQLARLRSVKVFIETQGRNLVAV